MRPSRLLSFGGLIMIACMLFLIVDVQHRLYGYRAVNGDKGIHGLVHVTSCTAWCLGDFVSTDGRVVRRDLRVNGAASPAVHRAAIADTDDDEAWTVDGAPWMELTLAMLVAVTVLVLGLSFGQRAIPGVVRLARGSTSRKTRAERRRIKRQEKQRRKGQIHWT